LRFHSLIHYSIVLLWMRFDIWYLNFAATSGRNFNVRFNILRAMFSSQQRPHFHSISILNQFTKSSNLSLLIHRI
jgi:hypothetical protein